MTERPRNSARISRKLVNSVVVAAVAVAAQAAQAATLTWTGSSNQNWSTLPTELNWSTPWTNNSPRSTPHSAIFDLVTPSAVNVAGNIDVGSITFTTGGWTLDPSGGVLAFGGSGSMTITTTVGTDTINAPIVNGSTFGSAGGTTSLVKAGGGTLILGGTNTYTGNTTVSAGVLQFSLVNSIAFSGTLTVSGGATTGGTVDLNGLTQTVAAISGGGGAVRGIITNNLSSTTGTLILGGSTSTIFDGILQEGAGTVGLTKNGTGTLTITGQHAYSGDTIINGGTLGIGSSASIVGSNIIVNANGRLIVSRGSGSNPATASVSSNSVTLINGTLSISSNISLAGFLNSASTGGRILIDTGSTPFTAGGTNAIDFSTMPGTGHRLGTTTQGIIASSVVITPDGSNTIRFGAGAGSLTVNAAIADVGATPTHIHITGSSSTALAGASSYTGNTVLDSGSVSVTHSAGLGSATGGTTVNGGILFLNAASAEPFTLVGGTIQLNAAASGNITATSGILRISSTGSAAPNSITLSGSTLSLAQNVDPAALLSGASTGGVLAIDSGSTTFTAGGANAINFDTLPGGGSLRLGATFASTTIGAAVVLTPDSASDTLRFGAGSSAFTLTHNGAIADVGATPTHVDITGASTTVLSGASSYTGITTVNGKLQVGSNTGLGAGTGIDADGTVVNAGGLLTTLAGVTLASEKITMNGGSMVAITNGPILVNTASSLAGTLGGVISGAGPIAFNGTTTLSGANDYTGLTTITADVTVNGAGTLGTTAAGTTVNAGTLSLNTGSAEPLTIAGGTVNIGANTSGAIALNSGILNINAVASAPVTVSGGTANVNVATGESFTIAGGITQIKAAATGNFVVSSGVIKLSTGGSLAAGSVQLTGGTFGLGIDANPATALAASSTGGVLAIDFANFTAGGSNALNFSTMNGGGGIRLGANATGSIAASVVLTPDATHTLRFGGGIGSATLTYNGVIADVGGFPTNIDVALGSITSLGGVNTYTGITTLNGKLTITNNAGLGAGSGVDSDGTVVNTDGLLTTAAGVLLGNEKITVNGGTINVRTGGLVTVNTTGNLAGTFNGEISGAGAITFNGATTLAGTNIFTGAVTVVSGVVTVNNAAGLGAGSHSDADGTTINSGGSLVTGPGVTLAAEKITLNGGSANVATDGLINVNAASNLAGTIGGVISGSGNLTFNGPTTLTATNVYTGSGTIASGAVVNLNGAGTLGTNGAETTISTGGTLNLNTTSAELIFLSGGTLNVAAPTSGSLVASSGILRILAGGSVAANSVTLAGATLSLTFDLNPATLLSPTSTGGLLAIDSGTAIPFTAGGSNALNFSTIPGGSNLRLGATIVASTISPSVVLTPDLTTNTLRFGGGNAPFVLTYDGAISDVGLTPTNVDITGASTTAFAGNSSYTGTTTVKGVLQVNSVGALGSAATGTTIQAAGTLHLNASSSESITLTGGVLNLNVSSTGLITNSGGTINANVSTFAPMQLNSGTLVAGAVTFTGQITAAGGTIRGDGTITSVLQLASGSSKIEAGNTTLMNGTSGPGALTLGQIGFLSGITINGPIAQTGALTFLNGTTTVNSTNHIIAPVTLNRGTVHFTAPITIDNFTINTDPSTIGVVNFTGATTLGNLTVSVGTGNFNTTATINKLNQISGNLNFAGPTSIDSATFSGGNAVFNGTINFTSPLRIAGTFVTVNGTLNVDGPIVATSGGLTLNTPMTIASLKTSNGNPVVNLNANTSITELLIESGQVNVASGSTLTLPNVPFFIRGGQFSGNLAGATSILKMGVGVGNIVFLGAGFSGPLIVERGALGIDVNAVSAVFITEPYGASITIGPNSNRNITLNNAVGEGSGAITFSGTLSGTIDLGSGGSALQGSDNGGGAIFPTLAGNVTGGNLTVGPGVIKFDNNVSTYTGQTILRGKMQVVNNGRLSSTSGINLAGGGELYIFNNGNTDHVPDTTPVLANGGTLTLASGGQAPAVTFNETIGTFIASSGASKINIATGYGINSVPNSARLTITTLVRNPGATLTFQTTQGAGAIDPNSTVLLATAPTLQNGILGGWAISTVFGSSNIQSVGFATWTPAGISALSTYQNDINTAGAVDNVSINSSTTLLSDKTINSLRVLGGNLNLGGKTLAVDSGGVIVFPAVPSNGPLAVIQNGTLTGTATTNGELIIHGFSGTVSANITDRSGGLTSLTISSIGSTILSGNNTYTGVTHIAGFVQFDALQAVPVNRDIFIDSGGITFNFNAAGSIPLGNITTGLNPASLVGPNNHTPINAASYNFVTADLGWALAGNGPMSISGLVNVWASQGANLTAYEGNITVHNRGILKAQGIASLGTGTVSVESGGWLVVLGTTTGNVVLNGGALSSIDSGFNLAPGHTFAGPVQVNGDAKIYSIILTGQLTVPLGSSVSLDTVIASNINASGEVKLRSSTISVGAISGTGTVGNSLPSSTSTLIVTGTSSFGGTLQNGQGILALEKSTAGVLTLTGSSTYTGGTTLTAGTLLASNPTGSATGTARVLVNGGTLGGSGFIAGQVVAGSGAHTIAPSATLTPDSANTLTMAALKSNSGTKFRFNLVTPGNSGASDRIHVSGIDSLNLSGGTIEISGVGTGAASLGYYRIFEYHGQTPSTSGLTLPAAANNIVYTLDTSHDAGFIDIHRGFLGDANDDGTVNFSDFIILTQNFGQAGGWSQANFLGTPTVDFSNFIVLTQHFGQSISTGGLSVTQEELAQFQSASQAFLAGQNVPEPGSLSLLAISTIVLLRRRNKH